VQAEIYRTPAGREDFELGFATFYLNRTNRSGILDARPIGGFDQQGNWKIDARFNREGLVARVQAVADMRHRVYVTELDALDFLQTMQGQATDVLVYADPPYLVQGEGLYLHAFSAESHLELAQVLSEAGFPWILTYDDDPRITKVLYAGGRCATFDIAHTAHHQHVGTETVIFSENLAVPDLEITTGRTVRWSAAVI
jgi:DNA adenine methylase